MKPARCYYKVIALFFLAIAFNQTNASENIGKKLSKIINQIKDVRQLLSQHQSTQLNLQGELQKTEIAINQNTLQLLKLNNYLTLKKKLIVSLTIKQKGIETGIKSQQKVLLQQIKTAYLLGLQNNQPFIFLRTNDLTKFNRLLTYNRYLILQSNKLITNLKKDLTALKNNEQAIIENTNKLQQLQKTQLSQKGLLDINKAHQKAVLHSLMLQMKSNTEQLNDLLKNKKNLEGIIEKLQKNKAYSSDFLTHHKGRFPWPTRGKIIEKFGSNIKQSELKQNGVLIEAQEGQEVYAVAPGRVIFANWLPGYGLLLIIDHGKGYMTLYGNNKVLYKKNSDIVGNHELIAAVGHTGGQQKSCLYFALRAHGKAITPSSWCGEMK